MSWELTFALVAGSALAVWGNFGWTDVAALGAGLTVGKIAGRYLSRVVCE
jgi:hypothetical protein